MAEMEGQNMLNVDPQTQGKPARAGKTVIQPGRDPLSLAILGAVVTLTVLVVGLDVFWGSGPVLAAAPWYIPLISSFVALTTLCISFLALGRYHVLRDPLSFWVGTGFAVYGVGQIFYALTWPGLLPDGRSFLASLPNTPAWIALVDLTLLCGFLLTAPLVHWPRAQTWSGGRWSWFVLLALLVTMVGFSLLISFESSLPVFVSSDGRFTLPQRVWVLLLLVLFGMGSALATHHYFRSGDRLAGYIVVPQLALVFICIMTLIGGKRYDLWWYLQRAVLVTGYLTVLGGLLLEYIRLLRRETEGTRLLAAIMDNVPLGLTVTGGPPHFPIARVSRYGLSMNQRPVERLLGSPAGHNQAEWRIFLPDGATLPRADQMPLYRASRFGEEIRNEEFVMQAQDGRQIPVLVNASPIRDAQGSIVAAINTWLDITDRKRAEEILRGSEALYRAIARSIPSGGVFVVDRSLRYIIAEGPVMEKFGYTRQMLEGHSVAEVFSPEAAAKMEARFHRVFDGETISYETEHEGRIYWTQHALMEDARHVIVITFDITERKQTEKALSESEQRFRAIINQATAGIVRSDRNARCMFVNQAFCKMLGYTEQELNQASMWTLTHTDDLDEDRRFYDRLMQRGIPFQLEKRLLRRDGTVLWVNVSAAPIVDTMGKPQSAVSVVVDITERKKAEADLQQLNLELESRVEQRTAELVESRKRLQVLSQRLVEVQEQERHALARELHDRVGQSLTALNLNLTIINDQLANQNVTKVGNRLMDSIKLVTEMIDIVRDVMADLRPVVLDEYGLVAALQSYIGKFETRYGIHVEFKRSHQTIPRVGAAMEMTILRIAQEALLNVVRHAQADHVLLSLQCEEDAMRLIVQDNGIGIPSVEKASSPDGHGLMIMRERAEAVGGTLQILSSSGQGTRVEALLPFRNNRNKITVHKESE